MKFTVGDKVIIKSEEELKKIRAESFRFPFANKIGAIQRIDGNEYTICMDDDSLNHHYRSRGIEWSDNGWYWKGDMLRLANLNRRIIKEVI